MTNEGFDKKWLNGLKFASAKVVKTEEGARSRPTDRALKEGDVLSWRDAGDTVILVAADGQKHTVVKK